MSYTYLHTLQQVNHYTQITDPTVLTNLNIYYSKTLPTAQALAFITKRTNYFTLRSCHTPQELLQAHSLIVSVRDPLLSTGIPPTIIITIPHYCPLDNYIKEIKSCNKK